MSVPVCPTLLGARMAAFPEANPLNLLHIECIGSRCVKWTKAEQPGTGWCVDNVLRPKFADPAVGGAS